MRFGVFNKFGAANSQPVFEAFTQAVTRLGHAWRLHDATADIAVIWSVVWAGRMRANQEVWNAFRNTGRPVVVLEVGMLRRGHTWKMSGNGTDRGAEWPSVSDCDRPTKLGIALEPWRSFGTDVVIALQRTDSEQWKDQPPMDQWLADVVAGLKSHTDRPIRIRSHPRKRMLHSLGFDIEVPNKLPGTYDDFDFDRSLQQAWCVLNWNSGPGTQAVIQGVPAFVGPTSLAAPVASLDWSQIESPQRPNRESWLNQVAHTEWTVGEIASGEPVASLLSRLESC
jgi:hypothetical protein